MIFRKKYQKVSIQELGELPSAARAKALMEMMPWIEDIAGKTIVIKYGGAAMVEEELREAVVDDLLMLKLMGAKPVIVHGGGPAINKMMERLGIPVSWKNGQRITDEETMEVVKMTLVGKVNQELVSAINSHGSIAVGLNGADAKIIQAQQLDPELGRVGKVVKVDTTLIKDLLSADYIPVIATVGYGSDGDFNINADTVAGEIAAALGAQKIVFMTDVDGLYMDFSDKSTLVLRMALQEAVDLAESGKLAKGMIPKINAIVTALSSGVRKAHIINGKTLHSLVLEIFTDEGVGTMIMRGFDDEADPGFVEAPVSNFAAKLESPIASFGSAAAFNKAREGE